MARITVEELVYANDTWQQTYMSTIVKTSVAGTAKLGGHNIPLINAPLVTTKSIVPLAA